MKNERPTLVKKQFLHRGENKIITQTTQHQQLIRAAREIEMKAIHSYFISRISGT